MSLGIFKFRESNLKTEEEKISPYKKMIRDAKRGDVIVEMRGITKRFPGVVANYRINFSLKKGEIHALLGENGAGKTTLMRVLYGIYTPDEGEIYVCGHKAKIKSPKDAISMGIFMVHQHFTLVSRFTVLENVILGLKSPKGIFLDLNTAKKRLIEISEKFGLEIDPDTEIHHLSAGEQQRVEILKALYRGAEVLILDEPTSFLTPQETKILFKNLRKMSQAGLSIIFITHKLPEVMAVSDRVTVLRKGKLVATMLTRETNEVDLARKMVGREVLFRLEKKPITPGEVILEVQDVTAYGDRGEIAIKNISLSLRSGEILGIAGVAGNGQRELAEVLSGMRKVITGKIIVNGKDLTNKPPKVFIKEGVCYIPEDWRVGCIPDFTVSYNSILKCYDVPPFCRKIMMNEKEADKFADKMIREYEIVAPSVKVKARYLSGGNIQRLILAREVCMHPRILIASQPTKGLDVGYTEFVRRKLLELRERMIGILLISEDLDEIMQLSDRIAVMYRGEIMGIVDAKEATIDDIGLMMMGVKRMSTPKE